MIGNVPFVDTINLITGQDLPHFFECTQDDPFPDGTVVTLYIYDHTLTKTIGMWPASDVNAEGAQFNIEHSDLDGIPSGSRFRVFVEYPSVFGKLCWYRGSVQRAE